MKRSDIQYLLTAMAFILIAAGSSPLGWAQGPDISDNQTGHLQQRIDFGNSYIMGQSIKSGAVYLLHRKQSEINSMLQYRENYRQEILEDFNVQNLKGRDAQADAKDLSLSQSSSPRK